MDPRYAPLITVFRAAIFCASLLVATAGAREPAAPYGADFAAVGARWADRAPAPAVLPSAGTAPEASVDPGSLEALRERVLALETEAGPYAAGLEEPLQALGRAFAANGDFDAAIALYRRALHLLRVNDGLYGDAQKPLVAALLGVYRAAGNYDALDEQMPYLYRLYGNGRPPLAGARLDAALAFQRWQREALRRELPGDPQARLLTLVQTGGDLVETAAADPAADWAGRRDLALSQLRNLYILQDRVSPPPVEFIGAASVDPYRRRELREVDPQLDRLESLQRTAFSDGERLLEALLDGAPDAVARSGLLRRLGDWRQWHRRRRSAAESYTEAYRLLAAAGRDDLIAEAFGAPVELPDNGAFWQPRAGSADSLPVVRVRFDVSEEGRARRVEGETVSGRDSAHIGVVRTLRDLRFRPRLEDGEPVAAAAVERRYVVYE